MSEPNGARDGQGRAIPTAMASIPGGIGNLLAELATGQGDPYADGGRLAEFVLAQLSGAHDARRATS